MIGHEYSYCSLTGGHTLPYGLARVGCVAAGPGLSGCCCAMIGAFVVVVVVVVVDVVVVAAHTSPDAAWLYGSQPSPRPAQHWHQHVPTDTQQQWQLRYHCHHYAAPAVGSIHQLDMLREHKPPPIRSIRSVIRIATKIVSFGP